MSAMHSASLSSAPDDNSVIWLQQINRRYQMGSELIDALGAVDLAVTRGDYLAVIGPSGSGKSTLMNIIGCLDTATGGEYRLNGVSVSAMNDRQLARVRNDEIGFVFQTFNLLPRMTALANVEVPLVYAGLKRKERDERARHALETVGLGDRILHRPSEMSGGQRQRVAIARLLRTRVSCWLTNRPEISTPRPALTSWSCSMHCTRAVIPSSSSRTSNTLPLVRDASCD
jgi:putative ABC transport system ATP-binding protein